MNIESLKSVLFLGIGGIGMSAIAKFFLSRGISVYGYDRTASDMTISLEKLGAKITFVDDQELTKNSYDVVIYTPAMPKDSFLMNYYQSQDTPLIKRSQALGIITESNTTIAVSGSHGKTTVSSMITYLLKECGVDCSAFLGGVSVNYNSNYIQGLSNVVVVEADEFDRSFMTLSPNITVLTSIDTDHLDIYGSRENVVASFQEFLDKLTEKDTLIHSYNVIDNIDSKSEVIRYGFDNEDVVATDIQVYTTYSTFNINGGSVKFKLNYNGRHNIENSLAAIAVGKKFGLSEEKMAIAIEKFRGIKRRFELVYSDESVTYIDDYAHHPTEIEALLNSVKEIFPDKKILSIFQPHLYSRTKDLAIEFAKSLDISDEIILFPLYPARELPVEGVSSYTISDKMTKKAQVVESTEIIKCISVLNFDVILTIGAGDISLSIPEIKKYLESRG